MLRCFSDEIDYVESKYHIDFEKDSVVEEIKALENSEHGRIKVRKVAF
jgi:hypothetical protein